MEEHLEDGELPGGQPPAKPPLLDSEPGGSVRGGEWNRVANSAMADGPNSWATARARAELVSVVDQDGDGPNRCVESHCHLETLRGLTYLFRAALQRAIFRDTLIAPADLRGAELNNAVFTAARIMRANFSFNYCEG